MIIRMTKSKTSLLSNNSEFSNKVLNLTKKIPKGYITTYKILANQLGTKAYRAVGNALKNNKQPIIIPCHRVVNSNGSIGGYCGKINNLKKINLLKKEGIKIKNNKIIDFERVLYRL